MENMQGFLIVNIYSFLVLFSTSIVFWSKKRLGQVEDRTYSIFLFVNLFMSLSGLILGLVVTPIIPFDKTVVILFNKFYLVSLFLWIAIFTFYIMYISLKHKEKLKKLKKIFTIIITISILVIVILPTNVSVTPNGEAIATGPSVMFNYTMFAVGFIVEIVSLILNYKSLKNKKYVPVYLLILLGTITLITQMLVPSLNYLINPVLIFIALIMYHTIENPDTKVLEELHKAKEISDSSNEDKMMFLYNMTNEIRGIIRDIDLEADFILNETDDNKVNIENISNSAREIKASTAKFTTMTNEILDISQVDSSNIKIYNEKYSVKNIIREVYSMYKNKCENKGLAFRLNIASDIPEYLYGDSINLKKALTTIIDNAYKYTEKGYIELRVNVIKKRDICRLIIAVEDSGTGIKSEELNRIFVSKNDEEREGTNLSDNLYNARKLITLIGGTIIPTSIFGKGTTIKIVLDQKISEEEGNLKKYEKVYDKKDILIVDDSEASCKIFKKIFDESNINLDIVMTGKECLDKIRNKEKYDLILLDEEMKPLSGIDVISKLKEIRSFNTPVLLLTKNNSYEYDDKYLKYGFDDFILKPIDKDKIFEKIDKYL